MSKRTLNLRLNWPMQIGRFVRRLNRFMVEVEVNNRKVLAHLPNSGRLTTVLTPKAKTFLKEASVGNGRRKRKSRYDVFAVQNRVITIVDTRFSNFLAEKAIEKGLFEKLRGYKVNRRNFHLNGSLLDFRLTKNREVFFLEVKSVTHVVNGVGLFPDAPTQRGAKHVQLLTQLKERGFNVGILFSVQRKDAKVLKTNQGIDPKFSRLLNDSVKKNVNVFVQTAIFKPPDTVEIVSNTPRFTL